MSRQMDAAGINIHNKGAVSVYGQKEMDQNMM